jgi:hypothetical protein
MPTKLSNLKINEVSGVDKAANGRKFLVVKKDTGTDQVDPIVNATESLRDKLFSVVKSLFTSDEDPAINNAEVALSELMSSDVLKAGRKISGPRLDALKQVHQNLSDIINEASSGSEGNTDDPDDVSNSDPNNNDNNNGDEESMTKGEHVKGCQFDKCLSADKEPAAPVTKVAIIELPEEVKKQLIELEDFKKRAEASDKIAKAERDARLNQEYIAKAASYTGLPVDAADFGLVLKSFAESDPEGFAKLDGILKASSEAVQKGDLFKEVGRGGGAGETNVTKQIEAAAGEIRKSDSGLTKEQAFAKALKDNPTLYKEYQKELRGGR